MAPSLNLNHCFFLVSSAIRLQWWFPGTEYNIFWGRGPEPGLQSGVQMVQLVKAASDFAPSPPFYKNIDKHLLNWKRSSFCSLNRHELWIINSNIWKNIRLEDIIPSLNMLRHRPNQTTQLWTLIIHNCQRLLSLSLLFLDTIPGHSWPWTPRNISWVHFLQLELSTSSSSSTIW